MKAARSSRLPWFMAFLLCSSACLADGPKGEGHLRLSLLSFNSWGLGANNGRPLEESLAVLIIAEADIIGLQETRAWPEDCTVDNCAMLSEGRLQALADSLERLGTSEVAVEVVHRGVGAINESDVLLATTTAALIIGFHVRPDVKSRGLAERDDVEIRLYSVIYEAVEDVKLALEGMLRPEEREIIVGTAEVRETFKVPKVGTVAGCYVGSGEIHRNLPVRLLREYVQIYDGKIGSLKRFKDDVREVREGYECGIGIEGYNDIKVGDVIECYRVEEVARSLAQSAAGN